MNKVETAIQYALFAHAGMKRKGKERPYILHPLEVLCIVSTMRRGTGEGRGTIPLWGTSIS